MTKFKVDVEAIEAALEDARGSQGRLTEVLRPVWDKTPNIFFRSFDEMGASDKMAFAQELIEYSRGVINAMTEAEPER